MSRSGSCAGKGRKSRSGTRTVCAVLSLVGKVHVSDGTTGHDAHLPIGSGEFSMQRVASLLRDLNVPVIDEAIPRILCNVAAFFEVELGHLCKLLSV